MAAPTVAGTLKVQAPVFIRKLRRGNDWGQPGDPMPERVELAVQQIFRNQPEAEISIYVVSSDDDLCRIAIGINAGRDSLSESMTFLVFTKSELDAAGISAPAKTPGNLKCDYANALHFDMTATDAEIIQFCANLMAAGRAAARCTEGAMKAASKLAIAENCKSVPNITQCGVNACSGS